MMGRSHLVSAGALLFIGDGVAHGLDAVANQFGGTLLLANKYHMMLMPGKDAAGVVWMAGALVLYFLGALLPDIDTSQSTIRKLLPFGHKTKRRNTDDGISPFHRTWTHSVWPMIALAVLAYFVPICFWLAFGYFGHLLMDSMSNMGVCWLYPFQQYWSAPNGARVAKGHKLKFYRANTPAEGIVVCVMCFIGLLSLLLSHFPDVLLNVTRSSVIL